VDAPNRDGVVEGMSDPPRGEGEGATAVGAPPAIEGNENDGVDKGARELPPNKDGAELAAPKVPRPNCGCDAVDGAAPNVGVGAAPGCPPPNAAPNASAPGWPGVCPIPGTAPGVAAWKAGAGKSDPVAAPTCGADPNMASPRP